MLDPRGYLLRAALGFLSRQGYDLELRRYNSQGWRATFYPEGFEHSRTAYSGSAWAPSPWEATQGAAAETLNRIEFGEPAPRDWTADGRVAEVR